MEFDAATDRVRVLMSGAAQLLVPLKVANPDRLAAVLARAEALAKGRDVAADDAALASFGDVDPVDWSLEAVRALVAERV